MACGCPVIASNVASIPEVCGDASYYVNPLDVQSIAEGLHKVLSDEQLRLSLIAKGMDRARLFTWDETARKTLAVFNDAIGEITNMVAGSFRTRMATDGDAWAISIPTVTMGSDFYMTALTDGRRTLLPFKMGEHEIYVELVVTTSRARRA